MSRKQHSGVFMMEMIMVVFFFILCASICILVFVRGDRMSREASDLNQSVLIAQSVAEVWKEEGGAGLEKRFGAEDMGSGRYVYMMAFDRNGSQAGVKQSGSVYAAVLSTDGTEGAAEITVSREEESIYTLSVSRHEREQGPQEETDG